MDVVLLSAVGRDGPTQEVSLPGRLWRSVVRAVLEQGGPPGREVYSPDEAADFAEALGQALTAVVRRKRLIHRARHQALLADVLDLFRSGGTVVVA